MAKLFQSGIALFKYTFLLQLGLRILQFVYNGFAFRIIGPELLGLVNLRLGLFFATLIFLSRESYRKACLSQGGILMSSCSESSLEVGLVKARWKALINVTYLAIPTGIIVNIALIYVWIYILPSPSKELKSYNSDSISWQYSICILNYAVSGIFELATEPFWLTCQLFLLCKERIYIEAFANSVRFSTVFVAMFLLNTKEYGILILGLPQILHGITLLVTYLIYFKHKFQTSSINASGLELCSLEDLLPSLHAGFDVKSLELCKDFFTQNILKQFLTEGERYLISGLHLLSYAEQGIYDLVSNLGSIPLRILYAPLDDTCHLVFSQTLIRGLPPLKHDKKSLHQAFDLFHLVIKFSLIVSLTGLLFAQAYSEPFMLIYARLTEASGLLKAMAAHVLVCGLNGPTEAFMYAAMTSSEILRFNWVMLIFSGLFLLQSVFLSRIFAVYGFMLANSINIFLRFLYSGNYVRSFLLSADEHNQECYLPYKNSILKILIPSKKLLFLYSIIFIITMLSKILFCGTYLNCIIIHCGVVGGISGLVILLFLCKEERNVFESFSKCKMA